MSEEPQEFSAAQLRALENHDLWATCEHALAKRDDHSCPTCGGTMRRCCDSLVGWYQHRAGCPEVGRRAAADVA